MHVDTASSQQNLGLLLSDLKVIFVCLSICFLFFNDIPLFSDSMKPRTVCKNHCELQLLYLALVISTLLVVIVLSLVSLKLVAAKLNTKKRSIIIVVHWYYLFVYQFLLVFQFFFFLLFFLFLLFFCFFFFFVLVFVLVFVFVFVLIFVLVFVLFFFCQRRKETN